MMMIFINQCPYLCISYSANETNLNNNQHENLDIVAFQSFNKLMIQSTITKPTPSLRPSTNLSWGHIYMSNMYTSHRNFSITPEEMFQVQLMLIQ